MQIATKIAKETKPNHLRKYPVLMINLLLLSCAHRLCGFPTAERLFGL
jgi:hypothetical protein